MYINARNIDSKKRPRLSNILKKKNKKGISVLYYLLEGEANRSYVDTLVILEEILRDHGNASYRLIRDDGIEGDQDEEIDVFRLSGKAMYALQKALTYEDDYLSSPGVTYDPDKQYVVDRQKSGRPRRVLTESEEADISRLRAQGMSINAISKELKINNRKVMEYCKKL